MKTKEQELKEENIWKIIKKQIKDIKSQKFKYFKVYQLGKLEGYQTAKQEFIKDLENNKRRIIIVKKDKIIYDKPIQNVGCYTTYTTLLDKGELIIIDVLEKNADYERDGLKLKEKSLGGKNENQRTKN